jgi:heme/copper-type cytochrome/quinol oxidase subunit 3
VSVTTAEEITPLPTHEPLPIDTSRGTSSMKLFIATEASLFLILFASYWYMGKGEFRWPPDEPPKLHYALPMLVLLLFSSAVLHWGETQVKKQRRGAGLVALGITVLMGLGFIALSVLEYREHLKTLSPRSDAYGSIFYTITTFHSAHLTLGLLMLLYVLCLPTIEPRERTPHRPYHNAALYWHFVDLVWVFVVAILYVVPNIRS